MTGRLKLLLVFVGALCFSAAQAHSPIVNDTDTPYSKEQPFEIDDPEHSKAIFSELRGAPEYYKIVSEEPFRFYAGILQAKLKSCEIQRSFSFEVLDAEGNTIESRNGEMFDWWPWYEEFGRSWYWVGPEIGQEFRGDRTYDAGTYWVRVFNRQDQGKYVLAIGDVERFGIGSIARLVLGGTMGKIREGWWDESLCEIQN